MRNRRVTVLGATGFIGRYVVRRLAAEGAVVAAVGRHASRAGFLKPMGDVGQIALLEADLADEAVLEAVVAGADAVVNLVGIKLERGTQNFEALHHRLPARLTAAARAAGVKELVHVSAIGADPAAPSAYHRSKAAGEAALKAGFPEAILLRPAVVFGPEDDFFNRFAAMAGLMPALPLIGGGATRFQPVFVGDVAAAVMAALAAGDQGPRMFELGGPQVLSFRELLVLMLREIGRKRLLVPVPFGPATVGAALVEWWPAPPLTRDQVRMLQVDNVAAPAMPGLAALGIAPTPLALILPTYLDRFRRGGRGAVRTTIPAA